MRQKAKKKRPKDRSNTERLLIDAAKTIFSRHGYAGATTRMIAKEAGVNLALIARYFQNKHGLLLAMIEKGAEESAAEPLPYPPQDNLLTECLTFAEASLKRLFDQIELLKIVIVQSLTDQSFVEGVQELDLLHHDRVIYERISGHFKNVQHDPKPEDVQAFVNMLERSILGTVCFQYLVMGESKEKCQDDLRSAISVFCEMATKVKAR
ncbi:MAG: TetR/AcrR family transcriptional regulator [Bdellovibrionales bacterium]|nr:TetR/AcrR family transcriptional regulator [Bdellovibrionales bacterium]